MSVETFQPTELEKYSDLFSIGMAEEKMQVLFAFCKVKYDGRGESFLDEGERMIVWKPDGNFHVHSDEKFKPVNYQPTGAETTVEYDAKDGVIRFVSKRTSPDETLTVECPRIYSIVQYDAEDEAEIDLSGTEKDMQMAIVDDPYLVEDGFIVEEHEHNIGLGAVDIFGYDDKGTPVIVEIKRRKAQIKHIDQLYRYINHYADENDVTARGILVAPSMSSNAEKALNDRNLEFVELDPLSI